MGIREKLEQRAQLRKDDLRSVYVEALEESIWYLPMSVGEIAKVQRKYPTFLKGNEAEIEALIELIVIKAKDENGEKLFKLSDKALLRQEGMLVISEIAGAMMGADTIEDAEGN
jgi:hypothetical protein